MIQILEIRMDYLTIERFELLNQHGKPLQISPLIRTAATVVPVRAAFLSDMT